MTTSEWLQKFDKQTNPAKEEGVTKQHTSEVAFVCGFASGTVELLHRLKAGQKLKDVIAAMQSESKAALEQVMAQAADKPKA